MKKNTIFVVMLFCMFANAQQDLPKVAVYVTGGKTANENRMLGGQITHALVNSGRFMTIERADAFLEQVAREHVTQRSGAVDDSQISRLGEQAGAQFVCIVEMVEAFNRQQISARIVDVRTVAITQSGIASGRLGGDVMELIDKVVATLLGTSGGNQQAQQRQQQAPSSASAPARTQIPPPTQIPVVPPSSVTRGTFRDSRDRKTYRTVTIGNQTWMAENLNFATRSGSWCYDNNAVNCNTYGRLYDWNTARTACPAGWRLPTISDWRELESMLGDVSVAGIKLRSQTGWSLRYRSSDLIHGTDDYGFSALPGGSYSISEDGAFYISIGEMGYWWTVTEHDAEKARDVRLLGAGSTLVDALESPKTNRLSVRCIRN